MLKPVCNKIKLTDIISGKFILTFETDITILILYLKINSNPKIH